MNNERNARLEDRNSPHFSIAHIIRRIQREGFYVIKLDEPINPEDLEQALVSMHDDIKTGVAKPVFDTYVGQDEVVLEGKKILNFFYEFFLSFIVSLYLR